MIPPNDGFADPRRGRNIIFWNVSGNLVSLNMSGVAILPPIYLTYLSHLTTTRGHCIIDLVVDKVRVY